MRQLNRSESKNVAGGLSLYEYRGNLVVDLNRDDKFNYVDENLSFTLNWAGVSTITYKNGSQVSVNSCEGGVTFGNLKVYGKNGLFQITKLA